MKLIGFIFFYVVCINVFAQTKTFLREYTYTAGEADSKITSRAIALDQVKRILLEEIGIYLHSEMTTTKEEKNEVYNELTKQQIQSITAGITETKIVEEKWNGEKYYIKASISVDPHEVNNTIARIGADQSKTKELVDIKQKADDAFAEIERLRKELASTKTENEKLTKQKEYNTASNMLSASDWFQKGYNADEIKDYDNAILYFQKAIELYQNEIDLSPKNGHKYTKILVAIAYNNLGISFYKIGNTDKAIQSYEHAIKLNPKDDKAYSNLGLAYISKGDFDNAILFCQKAIDINAHIFGYYFNLGHAYDNKGALDKAIQSYEHSIVLNPLFSEAYSNLGSIYSDNGNVDKAIQLYEKAIELIPQDHDTYYNLGIVYGKKGNLEKSIRSYEKAIELNPLFSEAYNNLGIAYGKQGNFVKSTQLIERSIELNPLFSEAYYNLGIVYHDINFQKALEQYKKAAKLGNKNAQLWLNENGYTW